MLWSLGLLATGTAVASSSYAGMAGTDVVQQMNPCKGVVKDATGEVVIGASVVVKGSTVGSITGLDGEFEIAGVKKGAVIEVSFVGYVTQEIVWSGQPLNIVLRDDTQALEEVVVVAFGTQKKVNVTGAVSSVNAKEITSRPVSSTVEALQGVVPGMNISTSSDGGSLKGNKVFNIRGTGTIGKGSSVTPLVLIDGMEGDINAINPQDIENISVLKDAAASSIYGSRAPGGSRTHYDQKRKIGQTECELQQQFPFQVAAQHASHGRFL